MINVREAGLAAGAEFLVMICGSIMNMPGLPKVPAANKIDLIDGTRIGGADPRGDGAALGYRTLSGVLDGPGEPVH